MIQAMLDYRGGGDGGLQAIIDAGFKQVIAAGLEAAEAAARCMQTQYAKSEQ